MEIAHHRLLLSRLYLVTRSSSCSLTSDPDFNKFRLTKLLDSICVAFRFKGQPFTFNRVATGLRDSMKTFITVLRTVLEGMDDFVIAYVDDVMIFSVLLEEHLNTSDVF